MLETFEKQPADKQDFDIDYSPYLDSLADTAQEIMSVTVDDPGLTISATSLIGSTVKVWTTGGVDGVQYKITCMLKTTGGREKEHDIIIKVKAL